MTTTTCPRCGDRCEPAVRCPSCAQPLRPFAEERRHATVVFADLCGFSSFAENRDPEEVHAVVDRCLAVMSDIVSHYGGTVTRVIGDEVMAVFGAPVAHGDDAERATRAALAITDTDLGGLQARIGVNTGEVFAAPLGTGTARQFTVTGHAVNLAARLREHAPVGGVLVGDETQRATRRSIGYRAHPPLRMKGSDAPVEAWAARSATAAPGRPLSRTPFVGRERERSLLRMAWSGVRESGRPCLATVIGPPGIGKSRLVAEFADEISTETSAEGTVVARGRCLPYGRPTPYDAVAALLRALASIPSDTATAEARARFDSWLAGRVGDRDASHLRLLAGLADEADTVVHVQSLVASMLRVLERLDRPAALIVEDLHWSSPSQLTLLEHVLARMRRGAVLVVALARPELTDRTPDWGLRTDGAVRIGLGPLPDADARAIVVALLGDQTPAGPAEHVVAGSAGVPLFLEELAADLTERPRPRQAALPGTVQDAVSARLDTLPAPTRSTALAAAVVGTFFTVPTLAAVRDERVEDDVALLVERDFVRPDGTPERFVFRHALIRDVAYHMLPRVQRRTLHERAARHLEEHAGAPDRSPELLAHHWQRAGDVERTVGHLLAAATMARRAWAKEDALRWYEKAAALLPDDDPRRVDIHVGRGFTLVERGDYPHALEVLEEVLPALEGVRRAEACLAMSRAAFWTMDTSRSQRLAAEAVRLAADERGLRVRCEAQRSQALSVLESRALDGAREEEDALAAWPDDAPISERVALLMSVGISHYWVGDYPRAVRRARDGYRLGLEAHDIDGALLAASHLGLGLVGLGQHEEALAVYAEAATLGREHELVPRFTARVVAIWGGALRELGDLAGARERAAEALELSRRSGFPGPVVQSGIDLLCCDLLEGRVGEAERSWPRLHEMAEAMRSWHNWLTLGRLAVARAEIALAEGDADAAVTHATDAEAYARRTHRPKYVTAAQHVRGRALVDLGRVEEAISVLGAAAGGARRLGHPPARWQTESSLAGALAVAGRDDDAGRHARHARETLDAFAATLTGDHRRLLVASPSADILRP